MHFGSRSESVAYLAANPSSYLYFDGQRVRPGTTDVFEIPSAAIIQACAGYDDYKYGLQNRNNYFARISTSQIRSQFAARQANNLLGEMDTDPHDSELDTACAAMLQDQRLPRQHDLPALSSRRRV